MTEESGKLLLLQQILERDVDGKATFVGLSVADTIMLCIKSGLTKRAEKIRSDWKVTDKQWAQLIHGGTTDLTRPVDTGG